MRTFAAFRRAWSPEEGDARHPALREFVETKLAAYADDRDFQSSGLDAPRLEPRWDPPGEKLDRWRAGETGFALVDAGMRELAASGWIHNRVRMATAGFLVKHLHLDWRAGEAWFAERLVDYDPAQNEGNWQWVAGTGIDAQPWFRIFNPERQRERFDPDGSYVERWRGAGYPEPILDLATEADEAKERFRAAATL